MKIFVSYSRRDAGDFARQIDESLIDEHDVFTDINTIQLGDVWSNTIDKNISTCDIFIVIVTFAALRSTEVEKEVLQAKKENKKIIPCLFRGIRKDSIKWGLEKIQGIEFSNEYQLARDLYSKIENKSNEISTDVSRSISNTVYIDTMPKGTMPKGWKPTASYYDTSSYSDRSSYSEDTDSLIDKGIDLRVQGKYQEANRLYDKILRIDPNNVKALIGKGDILDSENKDQEAIEYYDKALAIDPNNVDALHSKGFIFEMQDKYNKSLECYNRILRIDPNNTEAQNRKQEISKDISEEDALSKTKRIFGLKDLSEKNALSKTKKFFRNVWES